MVRTYPNYRQIRKLKSKTKVSDNRLGKQVKVKVKGARFIIAINYKLSWGKSNSKFYFRQPRNKFRYTKLNIFIF